MKFVKAFIVALCIILAIGAISQNVKKRLLENSQRLSKLEKQLEVNSANRARLSSLENDIHFLKRQLKIIAPSESPITPLQYSPNGSSIEDPYLGKSEYPIVVMAFFDYQCSPCRKFATTVIPLLKKEFVDTEKAKFVLRDFPLEDNTLARKAAIFAHCAGEQGKYWDAYNILTSDSFPEDEASLVNLSSSIDLSDKNKFESCLSSSRYEKELEGDIEDGIRLGARGAPGFLVYKQQDSKPYPAVFIRGAQPYGVIKKEIQGLLDQPS